VAWDISDGSRRAIDRSGQAPLARAVAASTAVAGILPAITLAGHRYMDGGTGSQTNADLAAGHDQVLVLAPARLLPAAHAGREDGRATAPVFGEPGADRSIPSG
jgi:NTE family protein